MLEWGCTPSAGKASGIVIAFRRKLFSFKNLVRVHTPPAELLGRVGAIRLKRGDVDFLVVNAYIPVNPHKAQDRQYCDRVWAWIHHVLSQAPNRCVPILCLDANGRVGHGESSPSIGPAEPATENYNGGKLGELLSAHHMAAVNTFFPTGDTYYGQFGTSSRIDYCMSAFLKHAEWRVAKFFLRRANVCKSFLLLEKGTICWCNVLSGISWLMTLPTHLFHGIGMHWQKVFGKDTAATCSSVHVSSHWHRQIYVNIGIPHLTLCGKFSTMRWWARRRHATNDKTSIQTILQTQKRRMRQWWLRGQLWRAYPTPAFVYQTNISMDFMSAILQQWRGLARYWKARRQLDHLAKRDRRHRTQEQLAVFNDAWQRRDFAEMWQTARFLSGRNLGPKKRVYNKPVAARPSIADWTEHLALPAKDGGWLATPVAELENKQTHAVQFADWHVSRWASADLRGLSFHIHKTKLRKAIPPWSAPAEATVVPSSIPSRVTTEWCGLCCISPRSAIVS